MIKLRAIDLVEVLNLISVKFTGKITISNPGYQQTEKRPFWFIQDNAMNENGHPVEFVVPGLQKHGMLIIKSGYMFQWWAASVVTMRHIDSSATMRDFILDVGYSYRAKSDRLNASDMLENLGHFKHIIHRLSDPNYKPIEV